MDMNLRNMIKIKTLENSLTLLPQIHLIGNMYYFYNYGVWTICDKTTGQVIGRAGFSNREGYEEYEKLAQKGEDER